MNQANPSNAQGQSNVAPQGPSAMDVMIFRETFSRMLKNCRKKCLDKYLESDLSVGEASCIDRCGVKYILMTRLAVDRVGALV
mmetsp:Transcript_52271/g.131236  ORF Transcript_52271/g.131236 Transcript_52271/m.131236 type:complete len:83 (-) Transcript_52271:250-498(-)